MIKTKKIFESDLDKIHQMGIIQGRMDAINELIDMYDGNINFLEALNKVQAKNGELLTALREKSS